MPKPRLLTIHFLILLAGILWVTTVYGAPAADLWPRWQKHDPGSLIVVDHSDWDLILQRYVKTSRPSGINRLQYSSVREKDRNILKRYLRKMQAVNVSSLNRSEQKAFWINLYNGLTVNIILEHYPVKSIRDIDISPGLFSNGPWDAKLLQIEGQKLSLNDIEHRILRPIWQDNRVHYAVNCASLGCPDLQPQAYIARNLDQMLDKAAQNFINHPRGVSFAGNRLTVSSIYFWFQSDFGDSEKGIIQHLNKYLSPENLNKLRILRNSSIKHQYDWTLNE
ncbi:DUF547 domain-containing protein [Thermodesulfobacteriota bacterium]